MSLLQLNQISIALWPVESSSYKPAVMHLELESSAIGRWFLKVLPISMEIYNELVRSESNWKKYIISLTKNPPLRIILSVEVR